MANPAQHSAVLAAQTSANDNRSIGFANGWRLLVVNCSRRARLGDRRTELREGGGPHDGCRNSKHFLASQQHPTCNTTSNPYAQDNACLSIFSGGRAYTKAAGQEKYAYGGRTHTRKQWSSQRTRVKQAQARSHHTRHCPHTRHFPRTYAPKRPLGAQNGPLQAGGPVSCDTQD